jgi:hypothetical protein
MKSTNILVVALALTLPTLAHAAVRVGIQRSDHDFSTNSAYSSWNTSHGVCSPCHQAHHTDPAQIVPLWNHETTTGGGSFQPYSSGSLKAVVGSPNGSSLACLSCHDGTVAINSPIGGLGTNAPQFITALGKPAIVIGENGDLHTSHPISFVYDSALASLDGSIEDPTTYHIGDPKPRLFVDIAPVPTSWPAGSVPIAGKTIRQALLDGQSRVQCTSCHDPHRMIGAAPLTGNMLKVDGLDSNNRGSLLCRTCHIK